MSKYRAIRSFRDGDTSYTQGKVYDLDDDKASQFSLKRLIGKVNEVAKKVQRVVELAEKVAGTETATKNYGKGK